MMDTKKSMVLSRIQDLIGVERQDESLEKETIGEYKNVGHVVKNVIKYGGAAGIGLFVFPMLFDKILEMVGTSRDEKNDDEDKSDLDKIKEKIDEAGDLIPDISVSNKKNKMLGEPLNVPKSEFRPPETQPIGQNVRIVPPSDQAKSFITEASRITGIDEALLLTIAHTESKFDTNAQAKSTGAYGLLQLTPATWNHLVTKYGKRYGIKREDFKDPRSNTIMGALHVRDQIKSLEGVLGRKPSVTDIYAAHFLGARGVKRLLGALEDNPQADAVNLFRAQALKNKNIFYNKDNTHKTVAQVYGTLYGKVGQQYLKFVQRGNQKAKYVPVNVSYLDEATPVDITLNSDGSDTKPVPVKVSLPDRNSETQPMPVKFDIQTEPDAVKKRRDVVAEDDSVGVMPIMIPAKKPEVSFIKDNAGRLITVRS